MLNILSGSSIVSPMFFLNWQNGVNYSMVAQAPQYDIQSLQDIQNIPITAAGAAKPAILADVASIKRTSIMGVVRHYNIRRVLDIYTSVQDRDLGSVAHDIDRVIAEDSKLLPRGSFINVRGQIDTMRNSYTALLGGLGFSVLLIYLLIVVNFQSWLDPFIIITALPAALAGIVLMLFFVHTPLSVPALMGAIMCMGVATANSILVISFAKDELAKHGDAVKAAIDARLHPLPPGADDGDRDDRRHDPDVAGPGRGRRAERAAGPRGDRRPAAGDDGDPGLRAVGVRPAAWRQEKN